MKKIVAIGGGTGLFILLSGLKKYKFNISAIVTMTDDGGSTGILRDEFGVLPPGDIRRCITALSTSSQTMRKLFNYRFDRGSLKGHSFGNLFITALKEITGSDELAIEKASEILSIKGKVIPVTLEKRRLCAKLASGKIIKGETNIDIPKGKTRSKIVKIFLNKSCKANPKAIQAIQEADYIIIGPGDLFTSILPNLLVSGITKAIRHSKAKKIYICNLATKFGETDNFQVSDFVKTIEQYIGRNVLDYVIFNKKIKVNKKILKKYAQEKAQIVAYHKDNLKKFNYKFIGSNLLSQSDLLRHNSKKLAGLIWKIHQNKYT